MIIQVFRFYQVFWSSSMATVLCNRGLAYIFPQDTRIIYIVICARVWNQWDKSIRCMKRNIEGILFPTCQAGQHRSWVGGTVIWARRSEECCSVDTPPSHWPTHGQSARQTGREMVESLLIYCTCPEALGQISFLKGKFSSGIEGALVSTLNHDFNWKQLSEMIICIFLLMFSKFIWVTLIQKQQKYK